MIVNGSNVRLGLFTVVAVLAWMNALALFGHGAAHWIAAVLQAGVGAGALVCAVTVARRVAGIARWWRLLVIAAMTSWLIGELFWWFGGTGDGANTAPLPGVVAYFMPPVLSLLAMMLLARSAGLSARRDASMPHSRVIAGLDGLVAAVAFSILVLIAGLGAKTGAALPRSQNTTIVIAYSV
ncbi:MAG: GGDEF-domain containing protein, partial [Mycolicibacterium sp.]|nr:GGDEF-domain containing protein [Mycolicibacterium sp.]